MVFVAGRSAEDGTLGVGSDAIVDREQAIDLAWIEPGQAQVVSGGLEVLQSECKQFLVELGPGCRPVHEEPKRFHLGRGPFVAKQRRNLRDAELPRAFKPKMAVDDFAITPRQNRDVVNRRIYSSNGLSNMVWGGRRDISTLLHPFCTVVPISSRIKLHFAVRSTRK